MATRPTYGPKWATNHTLQPAGSDPSVYPVIQPSSSKRADGWDVESVPYQTLNGILAERGEWDDYLDRGGHRDDLAAAVAATDDHESFVLAPLGSAYGVDQTTVGTTAYEISSIAVDCRWFYLAHTDGSSSSFIRAYSLADTDDIGAGNIVWTASGAPAGSPEENMRIATNGVVVVAIAGTKWFIYDCDDGALLYSGDHGAALADVDVTENWMIVVGADASNVPGRIIDLSDGSVTALTTWDTGADAFCCCAIADDLFFIACASDGSSNQIGITDETGANIRRANVTRTIVAGSRCASNGRAVFLHNGDTGGYLTAFDILLAEVWEQYYPATQPNVICDAKDVWLALDDIGDMYVVSPTDGSVVRTFGYPGAINTTLKPPIASNGQQTFRGYFDAGPLAGIQTIRSGLRARRWIRERHAPHFHQAAPEVL